MKSIATISSISIIILVLIFNALYAPVKVESTSMYPTLEEGDFLILDRVFNPSNYTPMRGDLILFDNEHKSNVLKRIVGIEGDLVVYMNKQLFIGTPSTNGVMHYKQVSGDHISTQRVQPNSYPVDIFQNTIGSIKFKTAIKNIVPANEDHYFKQEGMPTGQWEVPTGSVFVMGDNRDESMDSRYIGFIKKNSISAVKH